LGPATWLEVIDECPAADRPHRKQVVDLAAVIEGAVRTKRLKA
jgi:hypothetical protein